MKIDILSKQNLVSNSGIVRKDGAVPKSPAELKKVTREIKAALKEAGLKPGNYYVTGNPDGTVTVDTRYTPKETVSEAEFKRNMKAALKDAGFKVGGVKGIRGPGRKFEMVVKASALEESDLESESATKRQQANAQILFGKNASKVLKALELYSKEKVLVTSNIDKVLAALKTKDVETLEKFASSSVGKTFRSNSLKLANAKTPAKIFELIKGLKVSATLAKLAPSKPVRMPTKSNPVSKSPTRTRTKQVRTYPKGKGPGTKNPTASISTPFPIKDVGDGAVFALGDEQYAVKFDYSGTVSVAKDGVLLNNQESIELAADMLAGGLSTNPSKPSLVRMHSKFPVKKGDTAKWARISAEGRGLIEQLMDIFDI